MGSSYFKTGSNYIYNSTTWNNKFSLIAHESIGSKSYIVSAASLVFSDKRIKTNIVDVPDNLALQQVRDLPARYYGYKDVVNKGIDKTIGYIAQEVKEVLPIAVSQMTKIIPNEYHVIENPIWEDVVVLYGDVKYNLIVSSTDFSDNTYMNEEGITDISGVKYEFVVTNDLSQNETRIEIIGNSDNRSFTFEKKLSYVFIYGREVSDFLTVDKQKICALHHASIQEIDRLQTQNIERIKVLEEENDKLKTELEQIKTFIGMT